MLVAVAEHAYQGDGFSEVASVGFDPSHASRIFAYLSKSLYSTPHLSMFREICANALDAHRDAGEARPFRVRLPNALDSALTVRDFGGGMPHAFVMARAFSLGDSTKRDSNKQVGGFGLGCKTPFAVTDQFTLKVYRGDVSQSYLIDLHGGLPRVLTGPEMIETLATPETGTEWSIPVPENKHIEYREIAGTILAHFPAGSYDVNAPVDPVTYTLETPDFAICSETDVRSYALVGPVAYPINTQAAKIHGVLPEKGIELRMNVGDVTLHPSREQLEYDDKTIAAIKARASGIVAHVRGLLDAEVQGQPSLIGAQWAFLKVRDSLGSLKVACPADIDWQGHKVRCVEIEQTLRPVLDAQGAPVLDWDNKPTNEPRQWPVIYTVASWAPSAARFKSLPKRDKDPVQSYDVHSLNDRYLKEAGLTFVIADTLDKFKARIAATCDVIYKDQSNQYTRHSNLIVISQDMHDALGLATPGAAKVRVYRLSAATPWKPEREVNRAKGMVRGYRCRGGTCDGRSHGGDYKQNAGGVWCEITDMRITQSHLAYVLARNSLLPGEMIGVPQSSLARLRTGIKDHPGRWQHFTDYAAAALKKRLADANLMATVKLLRLREAHGQAQSQLGGALLRFSAAHASESLVLAMFADLGAAFDFASLEPGKSASRREHIDIARRFSEGLKETALKDFAAEKGIDLATLEPDVSKVKELAEAVQAFQSSYPMLSALFTHCGESELESLAAEIIAQL